VLAEESELVAALSVARRLPVVFNPEVWSPGAVIDLRRSVDGGKRHEMRGKVIEADHTRLIMELGGSGDISPWIYVIEVTAAGDLTLGLNKISDEASAVSSITSDLSLDGRVLEGTYSWFVEKSSTTVRGSMRIEVLVPQDPGD